MRGYVTLFSVIVISAVLLVAVLSLSYRSVVDAKLVVLSLQARKAALLADTCAQHAVLSLKTDHAYQGGDELAVGMHTCSILAIQGSGNEDRVIQTSATVEEVYRRVEVHVSQISPYTTIASWHTVAQF